MKSIGSLICLIFLIGKVVSQSSQPYTCPIIKPASLSPTDAVYKSKPYIDGSKTFVGGKIVPFSGPTANSTSPILNELTGERIILGKLAQMEEVDALFAVEAAKQAWDKGQGVWPQMSTEERIKAMEKFVDLLLQKRTEIVDVLTWEICKSSVDAAAEFDRTVAFIRATVIAVRGLSNTSWNVISGISAKIRRIAIGIMLCLG